MDNEILLENKVLLEKISRFNPKMAEKYGYLMEKWWRVPEEDYLYAQVGMRVYTGFAVALWIFSSLSIVADIIFFLSNQMGGVLVTTAIALVFGIYGLFQLNKSNKFKRIYTQEKNKFDKAILKRPDTDHALANLYSITESDVSRTLNKGLKNANSFRQFVNILDEIVLIVKQAQEETKHIYQKNKIYDYNLYEQKEIEAFKEVDSYITFEKITQQFHQLLEHTLNAREYAETENEGQFQFSIENLLNLLNADTQQD